MSNESTQDAQRPAVAVHRLVRSVKDRVRNLWPYGYLGRAHYDSPDQSITWTSSIFWTEKQAERWAAAQTEADGLWVRPHPDGKLTHDVIFFRGEGWHRLWEYESNVSGVPRVERGACNELALPLCSVFFLYLNPCFSVHSSVHAIIFKW